MKIEKLTVTLTIERNDCVEIPRPALDRLELNIEGTVLGTLDAAHIGCLGVVAAIRREGEA